MGQALGRKLRELRCVRNLTVEEASRGVNGGVSVRCLRNAEDGLVGLPPVELYLLAELYCGGKGPVMALFDELVRLNRS